LNNGSSSVLITSVDPRSLFTHWIAGESLEKLSRTVDNSGVNGKVGADFEHKIAKQ